METVKQELGQKMSRVDCPTVPYFAVGKTAGGVIHSSLRAHLVRRGFGSFDLVQNWKGVVGEEVYEMCLPIKFAAKRILFVRAKSLKFLAEFKYLKMRLIDRINTFTGLQIKDIKVI